MRSPWRLLALAALAAAPLLVAACDASSVNGSSGVCGPGASRACTCPNALAGTQLCNAKTGMFGDCLCGPGGRTGDSGVQEGPPVCGDGTCNGNESCLTCADDCGPCPTCNYAPSCNEAVGLPLTPMEASNLDSPNAGTPGGGAWPGTYDGMGPNDCGPAKLRMRLAKIHAVKNDGSPMYCIVQATDGSQSGVTISNQTKGLNNGDDYFFDPSVGLFWGPKSLAISQNNLTITYNCIQVEKPGVLQQVLMAAGNVAGSAGSIAGAYGWAFGLGDIALQAAAAALNASTGDKLVFNAQQTLDKNQLLDLTNGKSWQVTRSAPGKCDCNFLGLSCSDCSWTLTLESWGCADAKSVPQ